MAEMTGQCLCGDVRITVRDPAGWLGVCHCRICQRWSGGIWAGFPAPEASVTITGPAKSYPSSNTANRGFCGNCGTQLWMRDAKDGSDFDLMPGLFAEAAQWPLYSEIYHDQAYAAYQLAGDHKRATSDAYRDKNPHVKGIPDG